MRWFLSTIFVLVASPVIAQAQENEAEKLFRAMEKKIKEAKSLKVAWEGQMGSASGKNAKLKGSLYLADGGKVRIEVDGDIPGTPSPMLRVADGRQMAVRAGDGSSIIRPLPAQDFGTAFKDVLVPMGATFGFLAAQSIDEKGDLDIANEVSMGDFKLGAKERIGQREGQIVEFQMTHKKDGGKNKINARLWIDPRTLTPLKREMHDPANPQQNNLTETYSEFILDPQLDPALFTLPK